MASWTNWTRGSCEYHIAAIACRTRLTLLRMLFLSFGSIGGVIFVLWWMFTVSKWFQAWEDEPIIGSSIDVPKPAGDGTALENPSIKVGSLPDLQSVLTQLPAPGSTAIQCYAPATGEFLGFVNPTTLEGIDRAIEKAQSAQEKWERTTFTQRQQVLRHIQNFIIENQEDICRIVVWILARL